MKILDRTAQGAIIGGAIPVSISLGYMFFTLLTAQNDPQRIQAASVLALDVILGVPDQILVGGALGGIYGFGEDLYSLFKTKRRVQQIIANHNNFQPNNRSQSS